MSSYCIYHLIFFTIYVSQSHFKILFPIPTRHPSPKKTNPNVPAKKGKSQFSFYPFLALSKKYSVDFLVSSTEFVNTAVQRLSGAKLNLCAGFLLKGGGGAPLLNSTFVPTTTPKKSCCPS